MIILYIFLTILGVLLLILLIGIIWIYKAIFYTPIKNQNNEFRLTKATEKFCDINQVNAMIKRTTSYPFKDAYVTSFDHKKLHAKIIENPSSDIVCLMVHGYRGTPCRDFSGGAHEMIKNGYNVVLIEHRGHGTSKGHTITFGIKEKEDVKAWIDYIRKHFGEDKKLILIGISMGAATSLFVSDYLKENDKIIADCPYTTTKEILLSSIKAKGFNTKIFYPLVNLTILLFAHVSLNKLSADNHIANSKAKILIIHGEDDTLVPYKLSYRLYEKYPEKIQYHLVKGAEHGLSYIKDVDSYNKVVNDFINK